MCAHSSKKNTAWITRFIMSWLLLVVVSGIILMGLAIPSHFRSVSPQVLATAQSEGESAIEVAQSFINEGNVGLAIPLKEFISDPSALGELETEIENLLHHYPQLRWTGGSAPFYEPFVSGNTLNPDRPEILPNLVVPSHREWLLSFLEESPNKQVGILLQTRNRTEYKLFLPVFSNAGQPLDATILTTALALQSQALSSNVKEKIIDLAIHANRGDLTALDDLELYYASVLSLARRLNWVPFATLLKSFDDPKDLLFFTQSIQEDDQRLNIYLGGILLGENPSELLDYLKAHGDAGWKSLASSISYGSAGVRTLIRFNKPLYHPSSILKHLPPSLNWNIPLLNKFVESAPRLALVSKVLLQGFAGVLLISALGLFIPLKRPSNGNKFRLLLRIDKIVGGIALMMILSILIEPSLLHFKPNEEGSLKLNIAQVIPSDLEKTANSENNNTMIDQVTILILLFFFVLQLIVFVFGLIKINEIRRHPLSPEMKLKLLDNEENLFDLGLYVGLGGTVSSLILIVLNFVDASLMAAYTSTLFGIIFVAILKIGVLRPFRKKIILSHPSTI